MLLRHRPARGRQCSIVARGGFQKRTENRREARHLHGAMEHTWVAERSMPLLQSCSPSLRSTCALISMRCDYLWRQAASPAGADSRQWRAIRHDTLVQDCTACRSQQADLALDQKRHFGHSGTRMGARPEDSEPRRTHAPDVSVSNLQRDPHFRHGKS